MTAGIVNGTNLRIYIGSTPIGYATSCQLTVNRDIREILTKDSPGNGWRQVKPGQKSATLTTECLYSEDTTNVKPITLFGYLNDGTERTFTFTTEETGDKYYTGSMYCTNFDITAAVEENTSFTATFEVNGAITTGTET